MNRGKKKTKKKSHKIAWFIYQSSLFITNSANSADTPHPLSVCYQIQPFREKNLDS